MGRSPPLLLLLAVLLGCSQEPDDVFYWLGRVSDAGGAPRAGATATLGAAAPERSIVCPPTRRASVHFPQEGGYVVAPHQLDELRQATAGEDGAFYFDLFRFEINPAGSFDARCFSTSTQSAGGATARTTFGGSEKDLELPDLVPWEPALALQPGSPARVALPALPWTPSRDGTQEVEPGHLRSVYYDWVLSGPGGEIAWHQLTEVDPLVLEPDLVEDFTGLSVTLEAWLYDDVRKPGQLGSVDVQAYWTAMRPAGLALPSAGAAVPASRGASCTFNGAPLSGCPLTDGSLALATLPTWFQTPSGPGPADPEAARDHVVLALARPIVPRRLVMRDLYANYFGPGVQFSVEGSADGVTWSRLTAEELVSFYPTADAPGTEIFLGAANHVSQPLDSGGQAVQQIRLSTPPFTAFLAAREISIFE